MLHPVTSRRNRFLWLLALLAMAMFPATATAQPVDPYGDCCISTVIMTTFNTWTVTCGGCAANPGTYTISQPDPEKLVFVGPGGVSSGSRYEAARAICKCPSESSRRAREEQMRTFDGK